MILKILAQRLSGSNLIAIHGTDIIACLKTRICQCTTDRYRLDLRLIFIRIITESKHVAVFRCRMIRQSFLFPVPFYRDGDIFIFQTFQCQIGIQIPCQVNFLSVKRSDQVAFFQTCRLFRCSFFYLCDYRRIISDNTYNNHCAEKCKNKIKNRSCGNDGKPSPDRFAVKGSFPFILSVFSFHHTGTAERNQFQRISCRSPLCRQYPRSHSHRKFLHHDAICLCQ